MGKLYKIAEIIYKFIALNILWFGFVLLGLGVFGIMPATVALFSIIRKWLKGEKEIPLFSNYLNFYKAEFIKSNLIGLVFLILFYVLYVNFSFVSFYYDESIQFYIYFLIIAIGSIIVMTFLNIFSIMAHFQYKTWKYIKAATGLVFLHPFKTVMQIIWVIAYFIIAVNFPKVFMVIGVSVFAYVLMSINYITFEKHQAT